MQISREIHNLRWISVFSSSYWLTHRLPAQHAAFSKPFSETLNSDIHCTGSLCILVTQILISAGYELGPTPLFSVSRPFVAPQSYRTIEISDFSADTNLFCYFKGTIPPYTSKRLALIVQLKHELISVIISTQSQSAYEREAEVINA